MKRNRSNSYILVKVSEGPRHGGAATGDHAGWRMKHHVVWERDHGCAVPDGHVIMFANGDHSDFSPSNLVAVPKNLCGVINGLIADGVTYYDAASLEVVVALAKVRCAVNAARVTDCVCEVCGKRFTHDAVAFRKSGRIANGRLKTCDECLARGTKARGERCPGVVNVCIKCGREFHPHVRRQKLCHDCQPECVKRRGSNND